jgi:hypothetical protein
MIFFEGKRYWDAADMWKRAPADVIGRYLAQQHMDELRAAIKRLKAKQEDGQHEIR